MMSSRRFLAAAFLVFLLAEWGSHGLAFSHTSSPEGTAIHATETEHDDPCKTMVRCSDGRQQDPPNLRYDGSQHSGFLGGLFESRFADYFPKPPLIDHDRVGLRPGSVSPPFHPPKFSGA